MFNAEQHFLSKVPKSKKGPLSAKDMKIWLGNTAYSAPSRAVQESESKMRYSNITHRASEELHALFTKHVRNTVKEDGALSFMAVLSTMELIGAQISPISHREESSKVEEQRRERGVLINETKNTLAIFIRDSVKIFPKAMYNFILHIEGSRYFVIGPALRSERRFGK